MKTKQILFIVIFILYKNPVFLQVTEYRFNITNQGKTESGLYKVHITTDVNEGGQEVVRWKNISSGLVTTGHNVSMAMIQQDSLISKIPYKQLLSDEQFKNLWQRMLEQYIDRLDKSSNNDPNLNKEENNTSNQIWKEDKIINISIKAGKDEKIAYVFVSNTDNTKMICMNKNLKPFAGNFIEVNTQFLPAGTYWVYVSTASSTFSKKIMIY